MKPKEHQLNFKDSGKIILADSGGTGKTITSIIWANEIIGNKNGLIVTKKELKEKWYEELVMVYGKEFANRFDIVHYEFLRNKKPERNGTYSVIILDEAHLAAAPLFTRGRSQQATGVYNVILENEGCKGLPCTATPIRSNPWNLHTLLTFAGYYIEWKEWRSYFYEQVKPRWSSFPVWQEKENWRIMIRPVLKKYCRLLLLSDIATAPETTDIFIKVPIPKFDKELQEEWSPPKVFHEKRRWENGEHKLKFVKNLCDEYRKSIVVFYYREQGLKWYEELSKDRKCYLVYGDTKDAENVIKKANADDDCILLVQSSKSAGWDGDGFDTIIFATPDYAYVDYQQMRWRVTRIKDLKPVQYIHLVAGPADASVFRALKKGNDFNPEYFNKTSTSTEIEE